MFKLHEHVLVIYADDPDLWHHRIILKTIRTLISSSSAPLTAMSTVTR